MGDSIELADKNKVVRIRLGIDDENRPYFALNDSDGMERLVLYIDNDGNGSLGFRMGDGQPVMSLGISKELGTGMTILDYQNDARLDLNLTDGVGQIRLESKQAVFTWPVSDK